MFRLQIPCRHCQKVFPGAITQVTREILCPHCQLAAPFPNAPAGDRLWLVAQGNVRVGPFSLPHLLELASTKQLTPEHMVLQQGAAKWQQAKTVPGLFIASSVDETTKIIVKEPKPDSADDIFSEVGPRTPQGPLSQKGIKVNVNFSLTLGDFQIFRKLGAGGMGAVYLAQQRSVNRTVALKVLSEVHADKETFVNRFHREMAILASLDHPNIVKFIGAGQEKGIPFFAMEFIEGCSTAVLVKEKGKLAVGDALWIIRKSVDALNYAHAHKVVHRDIKPENIMITRFGQIKIADLGLAKSLEEGNLDLTDTGTTLGSPKYMAPEQSCNAKHADHRCDIYALGGVLYFLLTAEEPFKGETPMELLKAKEEKVFTSARKLNDNVPARLDLLIDKMLAKKPKYRHQTYGELIADLENLGLIAELLSFDPAQLTLVDPAFPSGDLVEILLIDNDLDDVLLARQALAENHIHNNLVVVADGAEARACLRREGKFLLAPTPDLIVFGSDLDPADSLLTLEEIKVNETLSRVPLIILASSPETVQFFESHGYQVRVAGNLPDDPGQFDKLFISIRSACLTVLELKVT